MVLNSSRSSGSSRMASTSFASRQARQSRSILSAFSTLSLRARRKRRQTPGSPPFADIVDGISTPSFAKRARKASRASRSASSAGSSSIVGRRTDGAVDEANGRRRRRVVGDVHGPERIRENVGVLRGGHSGRARDCAAPCERDATLRGEHIDRSSGRLREINFGSKKLLRATAPMITFAPNN